MGLSNMENIILTKKNNIGILTINRPKVKNALDKEAYEEFGNAIETVGQDSDIRVVVINGEGDSFCTGLDLKFASTLNTFTVMEMENLIKRLQNIFAFENLKKPVISAVQGYALGNGCDIALASDFIIAADNARFAMAYTNLGLIPDLGGTYRLPRLVGLAKARELILTGEQIDAVEALNIGMVFKVVPVGQLMDKTMEFANKLAKRAPLAMAMAKSAINKGLATDLHTACDFEAALQNICLKSDDVNEAISAFVEKRYPVFKGK